MNDLNNTLLMLLVRVLPEESGEDLFAHMQKHYDARLNDRDLGPLFQIGPAYMCRGQKFRHIQTFAGSLVVKVVFDTRERQFERPVIFRFNSEDHFTLLNPGGEESKVVATEIVRLQSC